MQRLGLLGLALVAVCALGVVVSATASAALPIILNQKKEVVEKGVLFKGLFKGELALAKLNGQEIKCTGTQDNAHFETGPLGSFHVHLLGCTSPFGGCTGLGDTEGGTLLALGTFHIVYDSLSTLGAAILALLASIRHQGGA